MTGSETDRTANPGQAHPALIGRFAPGHLIAGRFAVVRYIARGGMGEVYEVEDRFLQNVHVALKIIVPEIARDASSSHRFEQEVLLARKVVHPNLCPIYDIARCDDPAPPFLFLTMKLLAGETLSSRLRRAGPIPREEAITILRQLVAGLAAIHAAGVIHRDIKPNNVMLDSSGPELCVFIMDFGLARLHAAETTIAAQSLMAGTPGYMAPEILRGQGPSQGADLFALGVLLHEVLAGEPPRFGAISLSAEPTPALDKASSPPVFVHAVREFLSSEPNRRCVAFEQLKQALSISTSGQNWVADDAFGASGMKRLSRRQFAIGSAVAAAAAAGGVVWKWDRLYDLLHPLPPKRFVALVGWPLPAQDRLRATISSVVDAIGSELSRAEAFDHDLLIMPGKVGREVTSLQELNAVRESVGANLVLAASGSSQSNRFELLLRLIEPMTARTLRQKTLIVPLTAELQLPEMAVRTAAEVLNIKRYKPDDQRSRVGTSNTAAYAAFQEAERLRGQENDVGLDAAINKYKAAIDADPTYAVAEAQLAWAYLRSYALHGDGAALLLASANAKAAIHQDPNLVAAHLGLASVDQTAGDDEGASREMAKALALDPTNPHTLIYQAKFYAAAGQWREAGDTFARIFSLRPNYWLAHNEFGFVLSEQAKYPQALLEFKSASLAAPQNSMAFANVGFTYLQLGNTREAIANFERSYQIIKNDEAAVGLAEVNRILGNLPAAVTYARDAVALNQSETIDWLELGDCYGALDTKSKEATAAYRQARELQEDKVSNEPKVGAGWMLLALCRIKTGNPDNAAALVEKAERLGAKDIDSQLTKIRILTLLNQFAEALATVTSLIQRGATVFQVEALPDLGTLHKDPRYQRLVATPGPAV